MSAPPQCIPERAVGTGGAVRLRHSQARSVSPRAFTLMELLIVIGIIAILAGLLLPSVHQAKQAAHRIRCVSNLKQFALTAQLYADDHGGDLFRYKLAAYPTNGGWIYWFGWLQDGAEGSRQFDAAQGALYPYLLGRGVELCPSLNYALGELKLKAQGAAYGYGYNIKLSAPASQPLFNLHRASRPTDLVLFGDAAQVNDFQAPASPDHPMLEEFYYLSPDEATTHFRHRINANVAFGDGHVATEKPLPDSIDPRLPQHHVGRLRREILVP